MSKAGRQNWDKLNNQSRGAVIWFRKKPDYRCAWNKPSKKYQPEIRLERKPLIENKLLREPDNPLRPPRRDVPRAVRNAFFGSLFGALTSQQKGG